MDHIVPSFSADGGKESSQILVGGASVGNTAALVAPSQPCKSLSVGFGFPELGKRKNGTTDVAYITSPIK